MPPGDGELTAPLPLEYQAFVRDAELKLAVAGAIRFVSPLAAAVYTLQMFGREQSKQTQACQDACADF